MFLFGLKYIFQNLLGVLCKSNSLKFELSYLGSRSRKVTYMYAPVKLENGMSNA